MLCAWGAYTITVQTWRTSGSVVFWFYINSEVETVLFQVLSTISRFFYIIIHVTGTARYTRIASPFDLQFSLSFQVMLTMLIKKLNQQCAEQWPLQLVINFTLHTLQTHIQFGCKKQPNFNLVSHRAGIECWAIFPPYTLVLILAVSVHWEFNWW